MKTTWIVTADSARARLFSLQETGIMTEVGDFVHTEGREHTHDHVSDHQGRTFDSKGSGRHAMEPKESFKERENEKFAKQIAHAVEEGRSTGKFDSLVLMAAPEFLGVLSKMLSTNASAMVKQKIHKNHVLSTPKEIRELLT